MVHSMDPRRRDGLFVTILSTIELYAVTRKTRVATLEFYSTAFVMFRTVKPQFFNVTYVIKNFHDPS